MSKFLCGECIHNGCGCLIPNNLGYVDNCQHYMHKHIPNVEMTNEEYIHSLNTEQLAEWIAKQKCYGCNDEPYDEKHGTCNYCMTKKTEQIKEWLKKPHIKE